jgi:hypothetical protein
MCIPPATGFSGKDSCLFAAYSKVQDWRLAVAVWRNGTGWGSLVHSELLFTGPLFFELLYSLANLGETWRLRVL